ncbi:MAG: ribbon-helix-helix domain-containing protein [Victivallales bacterium]
MMEKNLIVRIDDSLKSKVEYHARAEGKNSSIVIRELLANYVKSRDIGSCVDILWNSISIDLKKHGATPGKISKAIREVRAGH